MTLDSFQIVGTTPDRRDAFKIVVSGSANSKANSFKLRSGKLSGP